MQNPIRAAGAAALLVAVVAANPANAQLDLRSVRRDDGHEQVRSAEQPLE